VRLVTKSRGGAPWTRPQPIGRLNLVARTDVSNLPRSATGSHEIARLARQLAFGFAYWFTFDLVLAAGSTWQALRSGAPIAWDQELLRFTGAGLLGAAATPLVLALVRRLPIEGPARWRRAAFHLASSVVLSAALITVSCVLAAWLLTSERRPFGVALRDGLAADLLLLTFCMIGFIAIAHAARAGRPAPQGRADAQSFRTAPLQPSRVPVKTRTGVLMVETASIDWIEAQGNYLALHVGPDSHLVRGTAKGFEAMLDPTRFARVHRRTIVAVDRVREVITLSSGDALIRLDTGAELRLSRGYREQLRDRLGRRPA
jgi:two-component system LytT family response regulator